MFLTFILGIISVSFVNHEQAKQPSVESHKIDAPVYLNADSPDVFPFEDDDERTGCLGKMCNPHCLPDESRPVH